MADVPMPPHVVVLTPLDALVVSCQAQVPTEAAEEEAAAGPAEPEVIGRKAEDEEEEAE
jgi:hypothetical protein